jgi:PAS domain-containing protein
MADSNNSARAWAATLREWEHRIAEARERTSQLRARSQAATAQESKLAALQELSLTHEELAVAEEELRTQNEELRLAHVLIDAERHRYRELFFAAPVPYHVTDKHGTVVEANQALAALLRKPPISCPASRLSFSQRTFRVAAFEISLCDYIRARIAQPHR